MSSYPTDVKLGDVDGDSDPVCLNQGQGTFVLATTVPVGSTPTSLVLADLDGNRTLDLVTANSTGADAQGALLTFNKPARYLRVDRGRERQEHAGQPSQAPSAHPRPAGGGLLEYRR